MGRYRPRTYEELMKHCEELQIKQEAIIHLLEYYTDTLGWGMQASLDYVVELFENGTMEQIIKINTGEVTHEN